MTIDNSVSAGIQLDPSITEAPENGEIASRGSAPNLLRGTGRGVSSAGVALLLVALVATVIGVLAAIAAGADAAMAVLVGYCSIISTVAACGVSSMSRAHLPNPSALPTPTSRKTSDAWKLVSILTVADASRLWCGVEPGATTTQETIAWGRALIDAIKCGELPIVARDASDDPIERERSNPHYMTQVNRDALKSWAARHGYAPNFLAD